MVQRLAGDGYSVVVGYGSNKAEADAAVAEAEAALAKATAVAADVADPGAVARLFDRAEEAFGGIDVVVNAAGLMSLAPLVDFDLDVLDRMLRTNINGTFILAHELRGRDVTVNAAASGPTATNMFLEGKDQELLTRLASAVPLERLRVPADIAPVVAFLASPKGTGSTARPSVSTGESSSRRTRRGGA